MLSPRDLRRELAGRLEQLARGDVEKLVLVRRGEMVGVVLTVESYAELCKAGS